MYEFSVHCIESFGDAVFVIGNTPKLGDWNPENGFKLEWTQGDIWHGKIELSQESLQYKYAILRSKGVLRQVLWECGENRANLPHEGSEHHVDEFRWYSLDAQNESVVATWTSNGIWDTFQPISFIGQKGIFSTPKTHKVILFENKTAPNLDGCQYIARPLAPKDAYKLGQFFELLSEETLSRYRPHDMTMANAEVLCDELTRGPSDKLRVIVTTRIGVHDNQDDVIVAYMILDFSIPYYEIERFASHGIPDIDPGLDGSFAPVVADSHQSKGIAFTAMLKVSRELQTSGLRRILLLGGVQDTNEKAKAFYKKLGFRNIGGYHSGDGMYNVDMILNVEDLPCSE